MVSVGLKYCHQCQAWRLISGLATQDGAESIEYEFHDTIDFGPFDSIDDILREAAAHLVDLVVAPGRPWVG